MINYFETGQKSPFFSDFDYDEKEMIKKLHNSLEYYLKLSREHIFEEVRNNFFFNITF